MSWVFAIFHRRTRFSRPYTRGATNSQLSSVQRLEGQSNVREYLFHLLQRRMYRRPFESLRPASDNWSVGHSSPAASCSLGQGDQVRAGLLATGLVVVTAFGTAEQYEPAAGEWNYLCASARGIRTDVDSACKRSGFGGQWPCRGFLVLTQNFTIQKPRRGRQLHRSREAAKVAPLP